MAEPQTMPDAAAGRPLERCEAPWGVLGAVALLAAHVLAQWLAHLCLQPLAGEFVSYLGALLAGALALCVLLAALARVWRREGRPFHVMLGLRRPKLGARLGVIFVLGAVGYVVAAVVSHLVWSRLSGGQPMPQQDIVLVLRAERDPAVFALTALTVVVIAPIAEELLFRSLLYQALRNRIGMLPAALLVSLVFAAFHFYPWGAAGLVVISLTFIALFERSGSLWVPIAAHGAYNAVMLALTLNVREG